MDDPEWEQILKEQVSGGPDARKRATGSHGSCTCGAHGLVMASPWWSLTRGLAACLLRIPAPCVCAATRFTYVRRSSWLERRGLPLRGCSLAPLVGPHPPVPRRLHTPRPRPHAEPPPSLRRPGAKVSPPNPPDLPCALYMQGGCHKTPIPAHCPVFVCVCVCA